MGGSCSSEAKPTKTISRTEAKDLQRKIMNKIEAYKVSTTRVVKNSQDITIREIGLGISSSPIYQTRKTERNFLGIKTGDCPEYGCAYSVNQSAKVELYTINSTIINEKETIWNDISSKAKSGVSVSAGGGDQTTNETIDEARDDAIKAIEQELESISNETFTEEDKAVIEYSTPILCEGSCNNQRGPVLNQEAYFTIKADNIINSVIEVIENKKRSHNAESETEVLGQDSTECVATLALAGSIILSIILAMWIGLQMMGGE